MQYFTIDRRDAHAFSAFTNDFIYDTKRFADFIEAPCNFDSIESQLKKREQFSQEQRSELYQNLVQQYLNVNIDLKGQSLQNLEALKEKNTFTVTTGHQLSLFTGPLFFVYKILHTIKLAARLNEKYPQQRFVPVYWMASEDHDFEEIRTTHIFNREITWNTTQAGAVGQFQLEEWDVLLDQVRNFFASLPGNSLDEALAKYRGKNLAEATLAFVHTLFEDYGLIIIDADSPKHKAHFAATVKQELETQFSFRAVVEQSKKLNSAGYNAQVSPRPINLFYLSENRRERILEENGLFYTQSLEKQSLKEMKTLVDEHPERFSPNVVLRPLYQEILLPNLVYIGGGGEIAYWVQLKPVFEEANIPFPLLQIRNSVQLIDKGSQKKLNKLKLDWKAIFLDKEMLKKKVVELNSTKELRFEESRKQLTLLQDSLKKITLDFDASLVSFIEAENMRIQKQVEVVEQKLLKQQKLQMETELKQVEDLKSKLFPQNGLQERHDNFMNFCPTGDYKSLFSDLYDAMNPFEKDLIVLEL